MTFKTNILASDEAQYLDANAVKTERTCLNKDGKSSVLWKIGRLQRVHFPGSIMLKSIPIMTKTFGRVKIMPLTEVSISLR